MRGQNRLRNFKQHLRGTEHKTAATASIHVKKDDQVTFEVDQDRKTGKSKAENVSAL